ncbi:MAG: polymerase, sigma-24 subunit, subfamily [Herbinix sp.]|nr:polymerase, sigma-24 subunit, subfamily [Herbinix sp.]
MFRIEDLYQNYKQDIFLYLMSLTHNHTLSEDLLSETFIKAIKSLPSFRGNSSVKTWLFGIARNTWLQYLRSHKAYLEFDDFLGIYVNEDLTDNYISKETVKRVKDLLELKEERVRQILWFRVDGLSYHEIASKLSISESSARVIEFRTKQWLKETLQKEGLM